MNALFANVELLDRNIFVLLFRVWRFNSSNGDLLMFLSKRAVLMYDKILKDLSSNDMLFYRRKLLRDASSVEILL